MILLGKIENVGWWRSNWRF